LNGLTFVFLLALTPASNCTKKMCAALFYSLLISVTIDLVNQIFSVANFAYLSHCYTIAWDRLSNQFLCVCVCMYMYMYMYMWARLRSHFQPIFTKFGKRTFGV